MVENVEDTRTPVEQCEGCYSPLGNLLDSGKSMADFNVTWYLCATHDTPIPNGPGLYDDDEYDSY